MPPLAKGNKLSMQIKYIYTFAHIFEYITRWARDVAICLITKWKCGLCQLASDIPCNGKSSQKVVWSGAVTHLRRKFVLKLQEEWRREEKREEWRRNNWNERTYKRSEKIEDIKETEDQGKYNKRVLWGKQRISKGRKEKRGEQRRIEKTGQNNYERQETSDKREHRWHRRDKR